jgi:hypothetical protein
MRYFFRLAFRASEEKGAEDFQALGRPHTRRTHALPEGKPASRVSHDDGVSPRAHGMDLLMKVVTVSQVNSRTHRLGLLASLTREWEARCPTTTGEHGGNAHRGRDHGFAAIQSAEDEPLCSNQKHTDKREMGEGGRPICGHPPQAQAQWSCENDVWLEQWANRS